MTVTVLLDHCALMHGQTVRAVKVTESVQWGPQRVTMPVLKLQGRRRDKAADWLRQEIRALAAVSAAARAGRLDIYTSFELGAERLSARTGMRGIRGDLWRGVDMRYVSIPVDRSRVMGSLTLKEVASRENQNEFFRRLLDVGAGSVSPGFFEAIPRTEFERQSLGRLHEFVDICRAVGPTRLGDAFHFWTALRNGLDYFLTTDRKFLDALRRNAADPELLVTAVSATELGAALDLPDAPLPIAEDEVVPFGFE